MRDIALPLNQPSRTGTSPAASSRAANRGQRLAGQQDFNRVLQDTADIVVITQDAQGRLLSINRYGRWICGAPEKSLRRRTFASLLAEPAPELADQLAAVASGQVHELRHESGLRRQGGDTLLLSWWHARWPVDGGRKHRIISIGLDISDQRIAEEHIAWLSTHDPLTGLFNRRRFIEEGRRWLSGTAAGSRPGFALMLLDLDQFKDINDLYGHQQGDRLLRSAARQLRTTLKRDDVIARLGGDEFGILLASDHLQEIEQSAQRCCNALAELTLAQGDARLPVTTSIGIGICPRDGDTIEALLANADIAMYQAKAQGRNTWQLFDASDEHRERIHERVYWEQQVREVLANNSIQLHFQPILAIPTNQISHHEALLRVSDGRCGFLATQRLISAAEQSGMIAQLDERVIQQVCSHLALLDGAGIRAQLALNLSGLSFRNPRLISQVRHWLRHYQIDPTNIIFEITETAALADIPAAVEVMQALRLLGCRFALDDFGVGFSSLSYLKKLPLDFVKIDGSFIRQLHEDTEHQVLIQALVDVAQAFQLKTVAEFVEGPEILDILRELGVDYAQGYHVGRPQAFETLWPL